ncbi:MAG: ring-cleaving dioxygenase [Rhodobacterales bacterium]|uniref:ring-cleaving dioxygenase n=1 Tax=Gemmobacter nectariphilus TaxID=220343 RepID=UPI000418C495|nr:ring-cleaving dioxygenase [Gemmobacter nectariphilus]MDX5359495.1 ring-cleaving dioxygenase [Rhodobacterales bacterium]MDX5501715.1 ring-cleaving dioxygenase [Rhodobacterales bacterium]
MDLQGIHHLTAVTANAGGNKRFYTETLGLRLVKKTVNQDDTSVWHLFYADGLASPGSDITFFDGAAGPERRGGRSVIRTGLRVSGDALDYWAGRLGGKVRLLDGRASLDFEDPEGQRLRLVADDSGPAHPWGGSPVPAAHQIRGLGPITMSVPDLAPTRAVLEGVMNMREERAYDLDGARVHVFAMGPGGAAAELHVAVQPGLPRARQGAGGVHHVAFRTPDADGIRHWAERVAAHGIRSSGEVDRYYFRSLYFREPGGTLFEIASDTPGFTVDEPLDALGQSLSLPPFLERQRATIEAGLKPIA